MATVDPDTEGTELNNLGNEVDQTTDATGDKETNVDLLEDQHEDGGIHNLGGDWDGGASEVGGVWDQYRSTAHSVAPEGETVMEYRVRVGPTQLKSMIRGVWGFLPNEA